MTDLLLRAAVLAQSAPPVHPDSNAPGAGVIQMLINVVGFLALGVAVLMILVGGITWAAARSSNNAKAQHGAGGVVLVGVILGFIVGVAQFAVNTGFDFGGLVK